MTDPLVLARLAISMADAGRKEVRRSEHQAVVLRTDGDGTCWVRIPGGADETPIRTRLVEAMPGDVVNVTISNGRATINGNVTSPTATTRSTQTALQTAVDAGLSAEAAMGSAQVAKEAADSAIESAETAAGAAAAAQLSADEAQAKATSASRSASDALTSLATVESVIDTLTWISDHGTYSLTEDTSVQDGKAYYVQVESYTKTDDTEPQQGKTYYTATETTEQVESYEASADTTVDPNKTYYTLSEGQFEVVSNPTGNPSESGYYELVTTTTTVVTYTEVQNPQTSDMGNYFERYVTYGMVEDPVDADIATYYELSIDEAVTNYVMSHVALTDEGLWILADQSGYRLLLSSSGAMVVDPAGSAVATYGESITFDSTRPQRIGNDETYVEWYASEGSTVANALRIAASEIILGNFGVATEQDVTDASNAVNGRIDGQVTPSIDAVSQGLSTLQGYMRVVNNSYLELGTTSETRKTTARLDSDSLDFMVGDDEDPVASIGVDEDDEGRLMVTRASFSQDVSIGEANQTTGGQWRWEQRSNGNLCLKWIATRVVS